MHQLIYYQYFISTAPAKQCNKYILINTLLSHTNKLCWLSMFILMLSEFIYTAYVSTGTCTLNRTSSNRNAMLWFHHLTDFTTWYSSAEHIYLKHRTVGRQIKQKHYNTTTTILRSFFWDHPGKPVPEENFWTLWCTGRLTEADILTIWLGTTPSGLTSAYLHHPPIFLQAGCPSCRPTNSIKALKATSAFTLGRRR